MNPSQRKTALIADDEQLARSRLKDLLVEMGYEVAAEAENGESALAQCSDLHPDIALLDIQMPGMTGLDVAKALGTMSAPPLVIFTTAFDHYAVPAFDVHAVDYLLKPVRKERLQQALVKAQQMQSVRTEANSVTEAGLGRARTHVCAKLQGNVRLIPVDEVVYFRAEDKYITVRHLGGEVIIEDSLKKLGEEFPRRFLRVHRNALVAKSYILALEKDMLGAYQLRLRAIEDKVEVSRRHVSQVRNEMKRL